MKVAVVQLSPAAPRVRVLDQMGAVKVSGALPRRRGEAPARPERTRPRRLACLPSMARLMPLACLVLLACRSGEVSEPAPASPPAVAAPARSTPKASERLPPKAPEPWRIPVGPRLLITPGKGFGPIRFGARLGTIERLLDEPCEEKRQEGDTLVCRYSAHAVDFVLEKGVVTQMRAHRLGRPFKPEPKLDYGIFNGRFESGLAFGMVPAAVRELAGAPKSVRPVSAENPNHTVEVHEYDGFRLEFDRTARDTVVLGGVVLDAPGSSSKS